MRVANLFELFTSIKLIERVIFRCFLRLKTMDVRMGIRNNSKRYALLTLARQQIKIDEMIPVQHHINKSRNYKRIVQT